MARRSNGLTRHHIRPVSRGGSNDSRNILYVPPNKHEAYHLLFGNALPHEAIHILRRDWTEPKPLGEKHNGQRKHR